MDFIERKEKFEYLLELIEKGQCFSLEQISRKFLCSKRTVKRMMAQLRNSGYEIKYCRTTRKFKRID